MVKSGDTVRLVVPENKRLHLARAFVREVTDWGAHCLCHAAATGQFRALFAEMVPYAQVNGPKRVAAQARDQGYSGDSCAACGGFKMRRAGTCECCEDCGSSSGCS